MLGSQATIQTKSKARLERGPAWHRSTTRKAILDTAREMIEEDGIEKTSLLRVAERAGFAPPTVYAYFVRKADLISAIVADDLSNFARTIVDGFPFSPVPEPEAEEDEAPETRSVHEEIMDHCAAAMESPALHETAIAADDADAIADRDSFFTPGAPVELRYEAPRSVETQPADVAPAPSGDSGALAAIEARITQLEARRADPWLERRLREFERMLATLDERVGAASQPNAGASADGRIQELLDRLEASEKKYAAAAEEQMKALMESLEARETRMRQTHTELRTMTLEATGRIEALERDRELRALATAMPAVDFAPRKVQPVEEHAPEAAPEDAPEALANAEESYLAAARRAALTAQSLAQAEEKSFADEVSRWTAPGKARTRLLVAACAGLGVVLLGAGFLLNHRAAHVVATPVRHAPAVQAAKLLLPPAPPPVGTDFATVYSTALAGNSRAQLQVGLVYLNGYGVAEDDTRAGHWLEAAAMSGEPVAQYWLATLFEHGKGESADPAEAIRWYEAAALQGNLKAMYKLAVSYAEGWGTRQNYAESARWFSRAAELGFVNAQFNLGVLYERGFGVPQSLLDAYKWYALAAAQGDKDSAARIEAMSSQLSPEDLASARDAVAAFKPLLLKDEANVAPALPVVKPAATAAHALKS
jgi:localization factor PodJL